mgnify:CR=1 FL=1
MIGSSIQHGMQILHCGSLGVFEVSWVRLCHHVCAGITTVDTADNYGGSELMVGQHLRLNPEAAFSTQVGTLVFYTGVGVCFTHVTQLMRVTYSWAAVVSGCCSCQQPGRSIIYLTHICVQNIRNLWGVWQPDPSFITVLLVLTCTCVLMCAGHDKAQLHDATCCC